jgi:hypothetical protein
LYYQRLKRRGYQPRFLDPLFQEEIKREDLIMKKTHQSNMTRKLIAVLSIPDVRLRGIKDVFTLPQSLSSSVKFQRIYGTITKVTLGRRHGKNTLKYFLHKALPPDEIKSSGDDHCLEELVQTYTKH